MSYKGKNICDIINFDVCLQDSVANLTRPLQILEGLEDFFFVMLLLNL